MVKELDLTKVYEKVNGEKREKLSLFQRLLLEYNEKFNLTSITDEKEIYYKHFIDSAAGESLFKENASVVEVGSGAGFPSLVLKILREDLSFTLVESVGKKCEFLKVAVDKLGLDKMNICNKRAEELARDPIYREKFDYAVARAVARMNSLSEYCIPFLKVGGRFIAYKSGDLTEIEEANSAYKVLGAVKKEIYSYTLTEEYGNRSLAVIEKIKKTPDKYPRGQGKERKNPL